VYDDLRARCVAFPSSVYSQLQSPTCVAQVFSHVAQTSLAHTLYEMKVRRAELLAPSAPSGSADPVLMVVMS
jgi:hypothetical protein